MISLSNKPIIVIGMHRSGTTMITEMLKELGMFVGENLDSNCEPEFFKKLNDWILFQAGASWDNPEAMDNYHKEVSKDARALTIDYLDSVLNSFQLYEFIGIKRFLFRMPSSSASTPWGWKDPRNTFTLPMWLEIFPQAKILNIYRHGVDVAASLRDRENEEINIANKKHVYRKKLGLYNFAIKKKSFFGSLICFDLNSAYRLWEMYVSKSLQYKVNIQNEVLNVKYEDFLENPHAYLMEIVRFCGLDSSEEQVSLVSKNVRKSRGLAYTTNPELSEFEAGIKERNLLKLLGYR